MTPYLNRLFIPYPTLHTWRSHQTGILLGYRGRLCITPPHTLHAQRRFMRYRVPFGYWAYVTSCSQRVRLSTSRLLRIVLLCGCIPCLHHYRFYTCFPFLASHRGFICNRCTPLQLLRRLCGNTYRAGTAYAVQYPFRASQYTYSYYMLISSGLRCFGFQPLSTSKDSHFW